MLQSPFRHLRHLPQYTNNSVMVVEGTPTETAQALQLAEALTTQYPRIGATLVCLSADASGGEPTSAPGQVVKVQLPCIGWSHQLLNVTNPGVLLFGGLPDRRTRALRRAAYSRGCAMALVTNGPMESADRREIRGCCAFDHVFDMTSPLAAVDVQSIKILRDLTRRQVRNIAFGRRRKTLTDWIAGPADRYRFPGIDSIEHLDSLLGKPKTLMCLGNGPSSEASALHRMQFDALFRVNSRWAERGYLADPDLIFTNQQMAVRRLRPRIGFVVRSETDRRYLCRKLRWRAGYRRIGVADPLALPHLQNCQEAVPSTGLLMLSTAVALQPQRLVVAGIDLFSDASGAYPGDDKTPNAYSLDHDRHSERRYLVALLRQYRGELIVVGEMLRATLAEMSGNHDRDLESDGP